MIQENQNDRELVEKYSISKFSYENEKDNVVNLVNSNILYNNETEEYTYKLNEPTIENYSEPDLRFLQRLLADVNKFVEDDFNEYDHFYNKLKSRYIESGTFSDKRQIILSKEIMLKDINESDIDRITEISRKCLDQLKKDEFGLTIFKNKIKSLFSEPKNVLSRDIEEEFKYHCIRDTLDDGSEFNIARIVFSDPNITKIELEDNSSIYNKYNRGKIPNCIISRLNTKIVKVYHKEYGWMSFEYDELEYS